MTLDHLGVCMCVCVRERESVCNQGLLEKTDYINLVPI